MSNNDWGPGPWQSEGNDHKWFDAETGYTCWARRHMELGHWCGYVAVPDAHPCHGKSYNEFLPWLQPWFDARLQQPIGDQPAFSIILAAALGGPLQSTLENCFQVHGGLTYSGTWGTPVW